MPALKTYDLFVSHAWSYNAEYYKLIEFLQAAPNFKFRNYSVPEHDSLINPGTIVGKARLTELLDSQIRPVNCFIVLCGMYGAYKEWIQREVTIANKYDKPILGVMPWGQQRAPVDIQASTQLIVGWNTDSIVSAIRRISI